MSPDDRSPYRCARGPRCANRVRAGEPVPVTDDTCPCQCHGQSLMNRRCGIDGGCGHLHNPPALDPDEPVVFEGGPILSEAGLCETDTARVVRALDEMPTDYTELHFLLASGESGITSDVVMGTREKPIPIRISVEALQARMLHESQAWAEPVAERLGIDWDTDQVKHCRPGFTLQRATRLLSGAIEVLLALPEQEYRYAMDCEWITRDGIDGALELLHLHDLTRFSVGKTKLIHRLPAPCPRCERMTLVRHNGCEHVTCESCGVRWPESDYVRLTKILAEDYRELVA